MNISIVKPVIPEDLMIGNYLKRPSQPEGFEVDAHTLTRLTSAGQRDEEPIELIPEELIRLGFKHNYLQTYKRAFGKDYEEGTVYISVDLFRRKTSVAIDDGRGNATINYVPFTEFTHELQNLVKSLTKQQLRYIT